MFFYVYVLECFVLVELYKLVVKAVWKLAYRQILVAICKRSKASKALKGFCLFFSNFIATVITVSTVSSVSLKKNTPFIMPEFDSDTPKSLVVLIYS